MLSTANAATAADTSPQASPTAPLAAALPPPGSPPLTADAILDRFVAYAQSKGLELYPAQEEAILELLDGKHLVLATPTGSGKSLVAMALLFKALAEGKTGLYTCPIKALVNEKFFALCEAFGPENVGMMTGDAAINKKAPILCCTAEILANLCLRETRLFADYVVMDEFHYYGDKDRGVAWQIPLITLPETTFLLMSATLGDMSAIAAALEKETGRKVAEVKHAERPVPLDFTYAETPLHETVQKLLESGKSPVYLVNFTQRSAAEQAGNLMSVDFNTREEKEKIRDAMLGAPGAKFDTPYGKEMQRFLKHGVGLHHAGLLPKYRLLVEKLAQTGLLKVISGTDTLGVGVNIPIRTVLLTQLCKYDGEKTALLTAREFHQIAGRAGRKGFDTQGSVVVQAPEHVIENARLEQKKQAGKKVVKRPPPQKGYVHWDKSTFEKLCEKSPEPLQSRFRVSHGLVLNLLQAAAETRHGGYAKLVELVSKAHLSDYVKRQQLRTAAIYFRSLRAAGIIQVEKRTATMPAHVAVSPGLQKDFSIHHTLALYLLDTLPKLDKTSELYFLDVLSLVESILENPDIVLYAQLDRLKGEKVAELKAQGMDYADRMAELEKLEWPKPNRDFIYATYNEFEAKHPWVGAEDIRPKGVAREMFEQCATFNEYVRDYGLQRAEGVLLRYLSEVYKTLVQSVPEAARTEELEDLIVYLRTMLRQVDSSLLDEWERLRHPEAQLEERTGAEAEQVRPLSTAALIARSMLANPKALATRIRADLHRLLKALARKDYEEAVAALRPGSDWTPDKLEKELAPYWEQHAAIDTTPAARRPQHTQLTEEQPRQYVARQSLLAPVARASTGHEQEEANEAAGGDWMMECTVDLRDVADWDAPLIELRRIST